jgi:large subunit ribosomal protein L23
MGLFGRKKEDTTKDVAADAVKADARVEEQADAGKNAKTGKTTKAANKGANKSTDKKPTGENAISGPTAMHRNISAVIVRPRITEKAALVGERNVYAFEIHKDATKYDVRDAVIELFKVTPERVRIVNKKPRTFLSRGRGRRVTKPGLKKAYVYLKKDDRIDLV